jgi:glycosyltransferase involved in cell wall biosynthesis
MIPFSIIVPTFNRQTQIYNLSLFLLSLLHEEDELIVVDDCSTDHTCSLLSTIDSPGFSLISLPTNSGGPAHPRNVGVANAKNDWICFCDSDDTWHPAKLSQLRSLILSFSASKTPHFIYHQSVSTSRSRNLTRPWRSLPSPFSLFYLYIFLNIPMSTFVCYKPALNQLFGTTSWFPEGSAYVAIEDTVFKHNVLKSSLRTHFARDIFSFYSDNSVDSISGRDQYLLKYRYLVLQLASSPPALRYPILLYQNIVLLIRFRHFKSFRFILINLPYLTLLALYYVVSIIIILTSS